MGMPGVGSSRPGKLLSPASRMSTLSPALVSTYAAAEPPAPLPMITTSKRSRVVLPRTFGTADGRPMSAPEARRLGKLLGAGEPDQDRAQEVGHRLAEPGAVVVRIERRVRFVRPLPIVADGRVEDGVAERLAVAVEAGELPADEVAVAAVFRRAEHAFDGVVLDEAVEAAVAPLELGEGGILVGLAERVEVAAKSVATQRLQRGDPLAIARAQVDIVERGRQRVAAQLRYRRGAEQSHGPG